MNGVKEKSLSVSQRAQTTSPAHAASTLPTRDNPLAYGEVTPPCYLPKSPTEPLHDTRYNDTLSKRFNNIMLDSTPHGDTVRSRPPVHDIQGNVSVSELAANPHYEAYNERNTCVRPERNGVSLRSDLEPIMRRNRELLAIELSRGAPLLKGTSPTFGDRLVKRVCHMASGMRLYNTAAGTPLDDTNGVTVRDGQTLTGVVFPGEAVTTYVNNSFNPLIRPGPTTPFSEKIRRPKGTENAANVISRTGSTPQINTTHESTSPKKELDLSFLERLGLTDVPLWPCNVLAKCAKCHTYVNKLKAIILRDCRQHLLCMACIYATINGADNKNNIRCPVSTCSATIKEFEINALLDLMLNGNASSQTSEDATSCEKTVSSMAAPAESQMHISGHTAVLNRIDKELLTKESMQCDRCTLIIEDNEGLIVQSCRHVLCEECVLDVIPNPTRCPVSGCETTISTEELGRFKTRGGTWYKKQKFCREDNQDFQTAPKSRKCRK